jgi:hypothetical protein
MGNRSALMLAFLMAGAAAAIAVFMSGKVTISSAGATFPSAGSSQ